MKKQQKYFFTLVGLLALVPSQGQAAEIIVGADGVCTLAEAITSANNDDAAGNGCVDGFGHDIITLETDILLEEGEDARPPITTSVTIEGQGHTIDGNGKIGYVLKISRAIYDDVDPCIGGDLTLNNATITGGNHAHTGDVTTGMLNNGGGITNACLGTVTLNNVTVSENTALGNGGGIFNAPGADLTLNNSTISGNLAEGNGGGGVYNNDGYVTLSNSTISDNIAAGEGGGICSVWLYGPLPALIGSSVVLNNSIISGNTASTGNEIYQSKVPVYADNYNLFGHSNESDAAAFSSFAPGENDVNATDGGINGILISTALSAIIDSLADNGGSTLTHALVPGSPAIDLDPNNVECSTGLATDQRGEPRPVGAGCDAGSYEVNMVSSNGNAFLPTLYFLLLRN
ncbi:MAG: choice-of-anchor Q domain-containing protein [Candidatus Electrothrix communis]|nr:MAG: choice-of-anchor Q domain-containing protein [Candidatus Electrothrix communis]